MPDLDGLEATRRILADTEAATAVLILTTFDLDEYVYEALRAGASGFLLKDAPPEQLVSAIHTLAAGRGADRARDHQAPDRAVRARRSPLRTVRRCARGTDSARARGARLIARGLSNREIASELVVSEATVKTHVKRVLAKLGVRDRVHAVVLAYESALVTPGT